MALAKLSTITHFCKTVGGFTAAGIIDNTTECGTVNRGEELLFSFDWTEVTCKKCLAGHKSRTASNTTADEKKLNGYRKDLKDAQKEIAEYAKNPFYAATPEMEARYLRNLTHTVETLTAKIAEMEG